MKLSISMGRLASAALVLAAIAAVPGIAHAQNLLVNGSFEDGEFTGSNPQGAAASTQLLPGSINITGWKTVVSQIGWHGAGNPYGLVAPDGNRSLDLTGYQDSSPYGGVTQTIATQPGAVYALTVMLGVFGNKDVAINASAGDVTQLLTLVGTPDPTNQWKTVGFNFIATDTTTIITIVGDNTLPQRDYIGLDNASVVLTQGSAASPEPGSFALLLPLAIAGAIYRRKR